MNWNPNQIFLDLGIFQVRYYSLMFVVAFSLGFYLMKKVFLAEKKPLEDLDNLVVYVGLATLVGARIGHCVFYDWEYFRHHLLEIFLPVRFSPRFEIVGFAGLASHGATLGIMFAMWLFVRNFQGYTLSWILDRLVLPVSIGGAFVRLGNFMNSEINGKEVSADFPFAVKFLQGGDFPFRDAMQLTLKNTPKQAFQEIISNPDYIEIYQQIPYRHPAQLYEAVCYVALFFVLWSIYWKTNKAQQPYFLFSLFFTILWSVRFLVEFVKESQGGFEQSVGVFSTGQWLSIPFIILGVALLFYPKWRKITE